MLSKRTVISQFEFTESAAIQIRLEKQVLDGNKVIAFEYHRTILLPGMSAKDQLAEVNRHLKAGGYEAVDEAAIERVARVAAVEHTPAIVDAWQKLKAARRAQDEATNDHAKAFAANPKSQATREAEQKVRDAEKAVEAQYVETVETVRRWRP